MSSNKTSSKDSWLGNPLPTSSSSSITTQNQNAALRGASLAFGRPPVKPKPQIHNYSGKNGALAAAKSVGAIGGGGSLRQNTRSSISSMQDDIGEEQWLFQQNTGSSIGSRIFPPGSDRNSVQQRRSQYGGGGGYLQPPGAGGNTDQGRSASFIAATLAASRSASLSPNVTGTGQQESSAAKPRRPGSSRTPSVRSANSSRNSDHALDTTPIPPTTSLIGMFEQNAASTSTVKRPSARRTERATPTKVSKSNGSPASIQNRAPSPMASKPKKLPVNHNKPTLETIQSVSGEIEPRKPPPTGRKPSISTTTPIKIPPPAKLRPQKAETPPEDDDGDSDDSFVSASDYQPSEHPLSFRAELAMQNRRLKSQSHSNHSAPSVTVDSLANAIVASSLASSRAASPAKSLFSSSLYPVPPPPRRSNRSGLFHKEYDASRTPSPAKPAGLRTTMRKPKSKEDIDEGAQRRIKKTFGKKHPNKHHEGDRKRWRDAITERERKRYEAVWASNRGLFPTPIPTTKGSGTRDENTVPNVVVRDVFSRSRLHIDVLEEVYELVDRGKSGRLEKEEFVIGLWLIDQRLKGRKLPIRVSDSVWKSVGALSGLKVKIRKKH
ncbi:uncharacterized protein RSE6_13241 [Rhynchosporium secalis]|uniref:EH domain-containing protein n=1 Tax=Rhynchosporium secalis TaxID=38038 RepID=A0A1E1MSG0_RHYSE|nr:uncharacterized protein RSE6_13241 [Rhynchosporium secalis]